MNERDLFRAIGDVSDDLIEEANRTPRRTPLRVYLSTAVAACLCIVVIFLAARVIPDRAKENGNEEPRSGASSTEAKGYDEQYGSDFMESIEGIEGIAMEPPAATGAAPSGLGSENDPTQDVPQDFSFTLSWEGGEYNSGTGFFTNEEGKTFPLTLTQQELANAWEIISKLAKNHKHKNEGNDILIEFTAQGEYFVLGLEVTVLPLSDHQQLIDLVEEAADRVR